jgi:hypothetical protein
MTHPSSCPLNAVDRRLDDLHQQWHQAENAYFSPQKFRVGIQAAIQTARTVSFILQSHKRIIPNFDAWYTAWQARMREDQLMRWMVDARNKIEKQGDLEAHSFVRAEVVASYLEEGFRIELPAELFDAPWKLLKKIPEGDIGEHMKKHGTLKVERRWVENTLPEYELLDAVALAYGKLSQLVDDAHRQLGLDVPVKTDTGSGEQFEAETLQGRLPCMIGHSDKRARSFSVATGRPVELEHQHLDVDVSSASESAKRYGLSPGEVFGTDPTNEESILNGLFETARKMFLKDERHIFLVILFRRQKPVRFLEMRPEDHAQKYLMFRDLANEVIKVGADAVIAISEAWMAPVDPQKPLLRAEDSPAREEALTATLVRREGTPLHVAAKIHRDDKAVYLDETRVVRDPPLFTFAPVYKVWGRSIPDHWLKPEERRPEE